MRWIKWVLLKIQSGHNKWGLSSLPLCRDDVVAVMTSRFHNTPSFNCSCNGIKVPFHNISSCNNIWDWCNMNLTPTECQIITLEVPPDFMKSRLHIWWTDRWIDRPTVPYHNRSCLKTGHMKTYEKYVYWQRGSEDSTQIRCFWVNTLYIVIHLMSPKLYFYQNIDE